MDGRREWDRPRGRDMWQRVVLLVGVLVWWGATAAGAADRVDFARDVRPILAQHCAACHGFDSKARKAGLRLDVREKAIARKAIVPGDPRASKLVSRVESTDEAKQMPPPEAKRPLSEPQKRLLRAWVEQGASYAQHWAFVAPRRPLPALAGPG